MSSKFFHKVGEAMARPFTRELSLLVLLSVLIPVCNLYHWCRLDYFSYAVYVFMQDFATVYLVALLVSLLRGRWHTAVKWLFIVWAVMWCMTDTFCFTELLAPFSKDFAAAMRGTNSNEISEFFETFFTARSVITMVLLYIAGFGLYVLLERRNAALHGKWASGAVALTLVMALLSARNTGALVDNPFYKTYAMIRPYESIDVNSFNRHPAITVESQDSLPQEIVVVIGESFSRGHSSLYGYGKRTNPRLEGLRDKGRLTVYTDVMCSRTSTVAAFKSFMSSAVSGATDWNEYPVLPCIFNEAGYRTVWVSNQSKHGMVDNLVTVFSELCDSSVFIGNNFSGIDRNTYDGEVLPHLRRLTASSPGKTVYFVHLVGSHNTFSKRYPHNLGVFTPAEYADRPENQRERLAHYDNSIEYNDRVVSEIMDIFSNREAMVVYFPDHGYDVFYSDQDYVGQGRQNSDVSWQRGREIPFMVYLSPAFEKRFPGKAYLVKSLAEKPFNTDNLPFYLCRLLSIKLPEK